MYLQPAGREVARRGDDVAGGVALKARAQGAHHHANAVGLRAPPEGGGARVGWLKCEREPPGFPVNRTSWLSSPQLLHDGARMAHTVEHQAGTDGAAVATAEVQFGSVGVDCDA